MSNLIAHYRPSRRYLVYAGLCGVGAAGSAWAGLHWGIAWIAAVISFLAAAFAFLALTMRPAIEVHKGYLGVGRHIIFWNEIRRVDRTRWTSPLLVRLTLSGNRRVFVLHPGEEDSAIALLHHLFRNSREALLDGVPHYEFWAEHSKPRRGGSALASLPAAGPAVRGRLLLPEDEAEVERLFQRLKTAGRLDQRGDQRGSGDE